MTTTEIPPGGLLARTISAVHPADPAALGAARDRHDRLTKPRGALGVLEDVSIQLCGIAGTCPPPAPQPAAVAVFAADHGVHAQGVSPWPQEVTRQMVANFIAGGAAVNALAGQAGAAVLVIDVGVATSLTGLVPEDAIVADATAITPVSVGPRHGVQPSANTAPSSGAPPSVDSCRGANRASRCSSGTKPTNTRPIRMVTTPPMRCSSS